MSVHCSWTGEGVLFRVSGLASLSLFPSPPRCAYNYRNTGRGRDVTGCCFFVASSFIKGHDWERSQGDDRRQTTCHTFFSGASTPAMIICGLRSVPSR